MQNSEKPTRWYRWWFSAGELLLLWLLGTAIYETANDAKFSIALRVTASIILALLMAALVVHIWRGRIRSGLFGRYQYQPLPEIERPTQS